MNRNTQVLLTRRLDDGRRMFIEGLIVSEGWLSLAVAFGNESVIDVGEEIELYRETDHGWVVQNHRVLKKKVVKDGVRLKVKRIGKPLPFDRRMHRRIPSDQAMIVAEFDSEPDCAIVDVGDASLGIIAQPGRSIGDLVELGIDMGFNQYLGTVEVTSVLEDDEHLHRYGVVGHGAVQKDRLKSFLKRLKLTIRFKSLQPEA